MSLSNFFKSLTDREYDIAALIGEYGIENEEIAERLKASPKTIEKHIVNIFNKGARYEIRNRTQIAIAYQKYIKQKNG